MYMQRGTASNRTAIVRPGTSPAWETFSGVCVCVYIYIYNNNVCVAAGSSPSHTRGSERNPVAGVAVISKTTLPSN